ncbi:MAG: hypothetical protein H6577_15990 [Lewinellaceae bacterium]|nr:hypothetical protein [Saprospiraceae bacterium]MCB9339629.1 hypothetical protein [Lewinellaceae bacterium]
MNIANPKRRHFLHVGMGAMAGSFLLPFKKLFSPIKDPGFLPDEYVGKYDLILPTTAPEELEVFKDGQQLFLKIPGRRPMQIALKAGDEFYVGDDGQRIVFNRLKDGQLDSMTLPPGILNGVSEPVTVVKIEG